MRTLVYQPDPSAPADDATFYDWRQRNPASETLLLIAYLAHDFELYCAVSDRLRVLAVLDAPVDLPRHREGDRSELERRLMAHVHQAHVTQQ